MALSAILQFGDNDYEQYTQEYKVAECKYRFARKFNNNQPATDAMCDKIDIVVIAPGKEDLNLYEWYIDQTFMSGRILFDLTSITTNDFSLVKELRFEDAKCFSISESYEINNARRRLLRIEFTAEIISIDKEKFTLHIN